MSQYSPRIKQRSLEEITSNKKKQIEMSAILLDMATNNNGWKIYESWLAEQYEEAMTKLKTCTAEELIEYQVLVRFIESIKAWMAVSIENGERIKTKLISKTRDGV